MCGGYFRDVTGEWGLAGLRKISSAEEVGRGEETAQGKGVEASGAQSWSEQAGREPLGVRSGCQRLEERQEKWVIPGHGGIEWWAREAGLDPESGQNLWMFEASKWLIS